MLNGHKMTCPKCSDSLTELRIPYMTYVEMDIDEREMFKNLCQDEDNLKELSTTYRMYKYSKWYKEQQMQQTGQNVPNVQNSFSDDNVLATTVLWQFNISKRTAIGTGQPILIAIVLSL